MKKKLYQLSQRLYSQRKICSSVRFSPGWDQHSANLANQEASQPSVTREQCDYVSEAQQVLDDNPGGGYPGRASFFQWKKITTHGNAGKNVLVFPPLGISGHNDFRQTHKWRSTEEILCPVGKLATDCPQQTGHSRLATNAVIKLLKLLMPMC